MVGCAAYGCSNRREQGFAMKMFPRDPLRRKLWASRVKRKGWTPTDSSCLCEVHFESCMWEVPRVDGKKKLKANAVPTVFELQVQQRRTARKESFHAKTLKMSLTIQQIILDAKRLASRLKEQDATADSLLSQTQAVYREIDAMRQYQEEVSDLNEAARQRPHSMLVAGIQQENRHLRELQQENRELRAALEEHQNALEMIMSKYRQQVGRLLTSSRLDLSTIHNTHYTQVIRDQADKICEMATVMEQSAAIDESRTISEQELISRLTTENKGLRELLQISCSSGSLRTSLLELEHSDKEIQTTEISADIS